LTPPVLVLFSKKNRGPAGPSKNLADLLQPPVGKNAVNLSKLAITQNKLYIAVFAEAGLQNALFPVDGMQDTDPFIALTPGTFQFYRLLSIYF